MTSKLYSSSVYAKSTFPCFLSTNISLTVTILFALPKLTLMNDEAYSLNHNLFSTSSNKFFPTHQHHWPHYCCKRVRLQISHMNTLLNPQSILNFCWLFTTYNFVVNLRHTVEVTHEDKGKRQDRFCFALMRDHRFILTYSDEQTFFFRCVSINLLRFKQFVDKTGKVYSLGIDLAIL